MDTAHRRALSLVSIGRNSDQQISWPKFGQAGTLQASEQRNRAKLRAIAVTTDR
jgi:hypothetical protein